MLVPLPTWLTDATAAIRRLAEHPWTVFALLLALNALARPGSTTTHDARLYSLQALNAAEAGAYANDVFLQYGSQDQYSLFSRVIGPAVALVGLRPAFVVFYLVFNTLFVFALFRLVRVLIADPLISTLALVYLVTAPLPYGGHDIFMVHEQFFTPRIIGSALTLFALERLLRQRYATAIALLIGGLLIHPLMAFGGVLVAGLFLACTLLSPRVFAAFLTTAALAGAMVLAIPAAGTRLFGAMDDDWHHLIRLAVGYNYPDTWPAKAWLNLTLSFALPIAACWSLFNDDPVRKRFLVAVTLAGGIGFLATLAASMLPYALLFQAQPYRVLWILKVMQAPLGFLLIARACQSETLAARLAALGLTGIFCVVHGAAQELLIFGMALPLSLAISRLGDEHANPGWWWYMIARGFVLGALGWMAYRLWFFFTRREVIAQHFDLSEFALFDLVSPIFCLVAMCVACKVWQADTGLVLVRWSAVGAAMLAPLALFATEATATMRHNHTRLGADIAFVRESIPNDATGKRPNVYCSLGRPDLLWIDVRATSYFDILQTAGVMFHRYTADEISRRSELVAKFEMARQRDEAIFLDDVKKVGMENLFKIPFNSPAPTQDDLVRLCQDPCLDYVVLTQEFPGLFSASNGRVFVYECYKVRDIGRSRLNGREEASAAKSPALQGER